tara:strand:+ start:99 stop:1157 length:1059 start_codon:yes stop_codon:yes gene_type:complete
MIEKNNFLKNKKNKLALITGSAGFIGFHLCKFLLDNDWKVIGYDALTDYYDVNLKVHRQDILQNYSKFHKVNSLIENNDDFEKICLNHQPDIIVHLAAQAGVRYSIENPESYVNSNLVATFKVLEAAKKININHLLIASSSSVYGSNEVIPFNELQKTDNQISFYGATKKANENMSHSYSHLYGIPITMFRFFTVYGPYGRPDMALFKFVDSMLNGNAIDIYNHGNMKRDFTYISDLIYAISLLIKVIPESVDARTNVIEGDSLSPSAPFRIINIGNSKPRSLMDFIYIIEKELGIQARKNMVSMKQGDVVSTSACNNLLKRLTSYKSQVSLQEGIKKFIAWYKEYYDVSNI